MKNDSQLFGLNNGGYVANINCDGKNGWEAIWGTEQETIIFALKVMVELPARFPGVFQQLVGYMYVCSAESELEIKIWSS